jgi:uncharacterized protein (DUF362 family)/Pyruvate/2-oxoacid:ferredoxin oxidoreductase delta subunit
MPTSVAIQKCVSYEKSLIKSRMQKCIELIGFNLDTLKGKKVLLKPNLLSASPPEKQVTTNPAFVRAAAEIALEAGASEVWVGDSPGMGNVKRCFGACGISEALKGLPVKMADFNRPASWKTPKGVLPEYVVAQEAEACDILINLPKLKTHTQMTLTCAVKNMFGLMLGLSKAKMHLVAGTDNLHFAKILVELCYLKKPDLTLVDGVTAMHGNGPGSGDPYPLELILAGVDPMAVDIVASEIVCFEKSSIPIFEASEVLGQGINDRKNICVKGESMESVQRNDFRPASEGRGFTRIPAFILRPLKDTLAIKPHWDPALCTLCKECLRICPVQVLSVEKNKIRITRKECIRCFCCQEICPAGVISARRNFVGRIIEKALR